MKGSKRVHVETNNVKSPTMFLVAATKSEEGDIFYLSLENQNKLKESECTELINMETN